MCGCCKREVKTTDLQHRGREKPAHVNSSGATIECQRTGKKKNWKWYFSPKATSHHHLFFGILHDLAQYITPQHING
jgi:hypothetical protein